MGKHKPSKQVKCIVCGRKFKVWASYALRGDGKYCSVKCCRLADKIVKTVMAARYKTAIKKCAVCGVKYRVILSRDRKTKFCSRKCMGKNLSKRQAGAGNPSWKGGVVSIGVQIRNCKKYHKWRYSIFKRDKFTCQECGNMGDRLVAHHIIKLSTIIKQHGIETLKQAMGCRDIWKKKNGKTMCESCHKKLHIRSRR